MITRHSPECLIIAIGRDAEEYMSNKYVIRCTKTGKYLSHLFEDTHAKTFQAKECKPGYCYFWNSEVTAKAIASEYKAVVILVNS